MDEQDWLHATDPGQLIRWVHRIISPRQFRLFVSACWRSFWDEATPQSVRGVVEILESCAEGRAGERDLGAARATATREWEELWGLRDDTSGGWADSLAAQASLLSASLNAVLWEKIVPVAWGLASGVRGGQQCHLLRDILGNPFRPVPLSTACLTPTVISLAQAAYDERLLPSGELDQVRLAVLADALEESDGPAELLDHLRGPGPHVRGCFVVDRILEKG